MPASLATQIAILETRERALAAIAFQAFDDGDVDAACKALDRMRVVQVRRELLERQRSALKAADPEA